MKVFVYFGVAALVLSSIEGKSLDGKPKTLSFPLHHQRVPSASSTDAQQPLPLVANGIGGLVYTVEVRVGDPQQHFNLTLDTNSQGSVLFAKGFMASNWTCATRNPSRSFFDPSQSATYQPRDDAVNGWGLFRYPYVGIECRQQIPGAEDITGGWGADTFAFDSFTAERVPFIVANHTYFPLNPNWPSDGIFPLGYEAGQALSKVFQAVGGNREVSLWLNGAPGSATSAGGRITFGGKDTQNCGAKWNTINNAYPWDWNLMFTSIGVGSKTIFTGGNVAHIAVASPFLQVPTGWRFFKQIMSALNAQYDFELDRYTVDCGKTQSLPGIRIALGLGFTLDYTVPAKDYVVQLSTKSGPKCVLLIVQGDTKWVFGSQFLPKRCVHLDYANNAISFADPVHN